MQGVIVFIVLLIIAILGGICDIIGAIASNHRNVVISGGREFIKNTKNTKSHELTYVHKPFCDGVHVDAEYLPAHMDKSSRSDEVVSKIEYNTAVYAPDQMEQILSYLTANMTPELREAYKKLFIESQQRYNLPAIMTICQITESLKYEAETGIFKTSVHIGQRKLALSLIQFLARHLPPVATLRAAGVDKVYLVYAGAAPGHPHKWITDLFPEVVMLLVDPNKFEIVDAEPVMLLKRGVSTATGGTTNITIDDYRSMLDRMLRSEERIFIINDLFTLDLARAIAELMPPVYFMSDIRTNTTDGTEPPDTLDILWNSAQQYNWMCIMRPVRSMLKFRHPFYNDDIEIFRQKCTEEPYASDFAEAKKNGIDFIKTAETRELVYWDGTVYIQAWPGPFSTESRLVTDCKSIRNWGRPEPYEDRFFYYNAIDRCYALHENPNANRELGFDYCGDCALENIIWTDYLNRYYQDDPNPPHTVLSLVGEMTKITGRHLRRDNHGYLFGRYPPRNLLRALKAHSESPETVHVGIVGSSYNPNRAKKYVRSPKHCKYVPGKSNSRKGPRRFKKDKGKEKDN